MVAKKVVIFSTPWYVSAVLKRCLNDCLHRKVTRVELCDTFLSKKFLSAHSSGAILLFTSFPSFYSDNRSSNRTEAQRQPHRISGIRDGQLLSESWSVFWCLLVFFSSDVSAAIIRGASPWLEAIAEISFDQMSVILHLDIIKQQLSECESHLPKGPQGAWGEECLEKEYSRLNNSKHLDSQQARRERFFFFSFLIELANRSSNNRPWGEQNARKFWPWEYGSQTQSPLEWYCVQKGCFKVIITVETFF